ncbi:hypothetical protein [Sulfurirhabdus autotrophica]|uniref:Uncharacterized protein n=1 Tax=Sulfurirhabdus autotrophica TaxID=1706046 RepID=A0A4R3XWB4_9PROT|nr:hypothetical protein [Sulfurirhabdus autotrophica]TCV81059.1 hypothetical protein EDC63_12717 [Sulfurirhabdus autotrophica]
MSAEATLLPKEVAALVHHIELNRSGWWDKVVQRLTLAAVWWSDHPASVNEIKKTLLQEFKLSLSHDKLRAVLSVLEKQDLLVALHEGQYRIPDAQRLVFEQDIAAAEKVELNAREFFCKLASELCAGIDAISVWSAFQTELLTPLIKELGANAYHLITGESLHVNHNLVNYFLKKFKPEFHSGLRELVTSFLDPKQDEVRAHVSRMLHARFCVEAGGLPESAIQKLSATVSKQAKFRVFVDTNLLFSLLELHENPSNDAARELLELITQLKSNPKVQLFIVPRTIEEAKTSIASAKYRLSGIPAGENFTQAALNVGVSGMVERFLSERLRRGGKLTTEDWFDPYLNDFVTIARGKGVEFFNESLDSYAIRQDVIDDILYVQDSEKRFDEGRRKSYQKVAHDMILWHFVSDQRPSYIESPIDSRDWILTVDYRLIGFDEYKQKNSGSKIPLCLHPTSLIQLLQFWVPRTKEFEEAMLGSMRLPFLFQEFDAEGERTSLRILKGLGRFEGRDDISVQTLTSVILNDGLRARLPSKKTGDGEAEIAYIRDALVEEMKARTTAEANKAQQLQTIVNEKEAALNALDASERLKTAEVIRLNKKIEEKETREKATDERLTTQGAEIEELKTQLKRTDENNRQRFALFAYFGLLSLVLLGAGVAAWQADRLFPDWAKFIGKNPLRGLVAVLVFVVGHLLLEYWSRRNQRIAQLWFLKQIGRFRRWLWALVVLSFMLGVIGNLYANQIQKQIDQEQSALSSPERRPSPVYVPDSKKTPSLN